MQGLYLWSRKVEVMIHVGSACCWGHYFMPHEALFGSKLIHLLSRSVVKACDDGVICGGWEAQSLFIDDIMAGGEWK